jgi:hypothetical protein
VAGDGRILWDSGVLRGGDPAKEVSVEARHQQTSLLVGDADDDINYDHADWADAKIVMIIGKTGGNRSDP